MGREHSVCFNVYLLILVSYDLLYPCENHHNRGGKDSVGSSRQPVISNPQSGTGWDKDWHSAHFLLLFYSELQPVGWSCPHSRWVFDALTTVETRFWTVTPEFLHVYWWTNMNYNKNTTRKWPEFHSLSNPPRVNGFWKPISKWPWSLPLGLFVRVGRATEISVMQPSWGQHCYE